MALPGNSRLRGFESVWTVEALGGITSLWSVCGDQSNMKKCTYMPMTRSPKHELASLVTSSFITADGLIRVWLARRLITCTCNHSRTPERHNPRGCDPLIKWGQGVQRNGATSPQASTSRRSPTYNTSPGSRSHSLQAWRNPLGLGLNALISGSVAHNSTVNGA